MQEALIPRPLTAVIAATLKLVSCAAAFSCPHGFLLMLPDRAVVALASYLLSHKLLVPISCCMQYVLHSRAAAVRTLSDPCMWRCTVTPPQPDMPTRRPPLQARVATRWRRSRGGAPPTPPNSKSCWTGRCACAASRLSPPRTSSSSSSSVRSFTSTRFQWEADFQHVGSVAYQVRSRVGWWLNNFCLCKRRQRTVFAQQ